MANTRAARTLCARNALDFAAFGARSSIAQPSTTRRVGQAGYGGWRRKVAGRGGVGAYLADSA
eukprot:2806106-Rhodomonas_salina.1